MIGRTVAQYRILERLGEGAMGEVWLAEDTVLGREVALKFLPAQASESEDSKRRFMNEARAAAALDHPNVGVVHEVGETPEGRMYIAMAYYGTRTLKDRIQEGPIALEEALQIARQIASGLGAAHQHGLIHRDIKPANIMLAEDGTAKIVDFGLVRVSDSTLTRTGATLGTIAYASPEQITGEVIDHRTDLWSLGVVLYELITGERPFTGDTEITVSHGIVSRNPDWSRSALIDQVPEIRSLIKGLMEKDPRDRPASAGEVESHLKGYLSSLDGTITLLRLLQRRVAHIGALKLGLSAAVSLLVIGTGVFIMQQRKAEIRYARTVLLRQAQDLIQQDRYAKGFFLAKEAQRYIPGDITLADLLRSNSVRADITSDPSGAVVRLKGYYDVEDAWHVLGVTPLKATAIPVGPVRFLIECEGRSPVETFDVTEWPEQGMSRPTEWHLRLPPAGSDTSMVRIPASLVSSYPAMSEKTVYEVPEYLLGRFEVTNQEYQDFVDSGGYGRTEYWNGLEFIDEDNGSTLALDEALTRFVDPTGFPGPATWEYGRYPEGREQHPVTGVSWYEAAAYARFADKDMPTLYHWSGAVDNRVGMTETWSEFFGPLTYAGAFMGISLHYCVETGCIDVEDTMPVGASGAMGPNGLYDLVGNVREWIWNRTEEGDRVLLGKSHSDPFYAVQIPDVVSAWDRSARNGIRLACYPAMDQSLLDEMRGPVALVPSEEVAAADLSDGVSILPPQTVSEEVYRTIESQYRSFRPAPPEPVSVDTLIDRYWIRRRVEINTFYGSRMGVYVFTPRNLQPPYQTVVFRPGQWGAGSTHSGDNLALLYFAWLLQRGRAVVHPVWYSTFERGTEFLEDCRHGLAGEVLKRGYLDLVATLDYLEAFEEDLDLERLAFMGYSAGSTTAPPHLVLEPRLKTAVLMGVGNQWVCGSNLMGRPDIFLPHITLPILLLNGRHDLFYPVESQLMPFFELLGTREEQKRMAVVETNHGVMEKRYEVIQVISEWLDTYLGPVASRRKAP